MSSVSALRFFTAAVAFATVCVGCAGGNQLAIKYATNYTPPTGPFSVLGVFENGRLSPEAWLEVGPGLSSNFSRNLCETAWNDGFLSASSTLAATIDEYTKDNGITDALLDRLAPMARGGSILSFTVLGRQQRPDSEGDTKSKGAVPAAPVRTGGGMSGVGRGGMRGTGWAQPSLSDNPNSETNQAAYEISALLFSIQQRRSILLVSMTHAGPNLDTALQEFSTKLRTAIPNVTCTGWNLDAQIDIAGIRALINPKVPEPVGDLDQTRPRP